MRKQTADRRYARLLPETLPSGVYVMEITKVRQRNGNVVITDAVVVCPTCRTQLKTVKALGRAGLIPTVRKAAR